MADRRGATCDAGLAAGPLAVAQGVAEQQVERGARRPFALGDLPRRADLAEDLALAEHGRVEPGGDLEQVGHRAVVVLAVEVRRELVDAEVAELAQEVADVGVGAVEALGDDVDLGAVARGQDHRLAEVVALGQPGHGLGEVVGGDRDAAPAGPADPCGG